MKVLSNITTKMLSKISYGELFYLNSGVYSCFCIIVKDNEIDFMLCLKNPFNDNQGGVYHSSFYTKRPQPQHDTPVKSFGTEWVAVPHNANTANINNNFNLINHSAALLIENARALISVHPYRVDHLDGPTAFETNTWAGDDYDRSLTIPFTEWDIWATEDDYKNYPDNPLVQIRA